ncbi:hypothetical protein TYRP_021049 [Tyrophagus putrescentiae]|nr:hypothetical protein TYRP_021049 [Tyrophagus putrescentiae]
MMMMMMMAVPTKVVVQKSSTIRSVSWGLSSAVRQWQKADREAMGTDRVLITRPASRAPEAK